MRLADYVVSYSLQINNRCLRYLAECDAPGGGPAEPSDLVVHDTHTVYAESLLARDSRRLVSMWSLMEPAWKDAGVEMATHVEALDSGARLLTGAASSRRLALRLANLAAEDYEAQAILRVARNLPAEVPMSWDALNDLFAQDSHFWRKSPSFQQLQDEVLQQRITRSYRKAYRLAALLTEDGAQTWLDQHSEPLYQWVQLSAHQLELLRPGLSDKGRAQLWYLDKMADTLRTRAGLRALKHATASVAVKKSAVKLVIAYVEQQIDKMDKRLVRLVKGSFSSKPKRMNTFTEAAVGNLGLRSVSLMQPAGSTTPSGDDDSLVTEGS